jgi:outer membrane protein assembly factor BamD
VSAPNGQPADPNSLVKPVQATNTVLPGADKPAEAPLQQNEIKPGTTPTAPNTAEKAKKPKTDLSEESSSKKKKKKGLGKINPF